MSLARVTCLLALTAFDLLGCQGINSAQAQTFFVYWTKNGQWCGIADVAQYKAKVDANEAPQPDATEGSDEIERGAVSVAGGRVVWVEDYFDVAEGEVIVRTRYFVRADGSISSAQHIRTTYEGSDGHFTEKARYKLVNGTYVEQSAPSSLSDIRRYRRKEMDASLGRLTSIEGFRFSPLISAIQQAPALPEICVTAEKKP